MILKLKQTPGVYLIGFMGSGKTTIGRLIFRLYDVKSGSIKINGTDLREAQLESLRRNISIVTQDVQLFRASIRENLTFFDRSISDEKISYKILLLSFNML